MTHYPAEQLVAHYGMLPHPEGGYYRETYRSVAQLPVSEQGDGFPAGRSFGTAIYYLLEKGDFSAFHRIKSDEIWHFYAGGPLLVHVIDPLSGLLSVLSLGSDPLAGESFQGVVPAGHWFAAEPGPGTAYALAGCTVAPGFDFQDFEMAGRDALLDLFPGHREEIVRLTRC